MNNRGLISEKREATSKLRRNKELLWFGTWFLSVLVLAGCARQEQIEREFQANRQASYEALQRAAEGESSEEMPVVSGQLGFEECLELALVNNRDVQAAKIQLLIADGQMTEAVATALPSAVYSASALRNDNSGFANQKETYQLQLLVRQPLYLGGLTGAALDAASVFTYMTGQQLRQVVHDVQLRVRQKYLAAVLAQEMVKVAQQAKRDAQEHLADTEAKLKHGTGTRFEVLRGEVRVNAVEAELIQRENDERLALTSLLDEMGVSQFSEIELGGALDYEKIEPAGKESLYQAIKQRPELLIGEAMVRLAKNNIKAEQATNRPKVYLQGMHQLDYPGFSANFGDFFPADNSDPGGSAPTVTLDKEWERTMNGGIVVEWPLFDGFRTDGKVTQAKAQMHSQQISLKKGEQLVQLQVTQALLNLQSSDKFVQSQQGNVSNAQESLRLAQVKFRTGAGSSLDVISAETALSQARANYLRAVHDYQLAQVNLDWAIGIIGDIPSEEVTPHEPTLNTIGEDKNP
jgi:outer membrane protein TolC